MMYEGWFLGATKELLRFRVGMTFLSIGERRSKPCQDDRVTDSRPHEARRSAALSRARIVHTTIEVLDDGGVDALTFRELSTRLSTGSGAIYHHVANKAALLATAASEVMTSTLDRDGLGQSAPNVRALMLSTFDAIHAHPWLGTQLTVAPWQPAVLQLLERIGSHLDALGVPEHAQFDAASVFVHHLLGFASQFDAMSGLPGARVSRPAFLEQATAALTQHGNQDRYPFLTRIARQLANHDDRELYETGLDVIIAGISSR